MIYATIAGILFYALWSISSVETGDFDLKNLVSQDHKFTSHVMILLLIYVIMLILEKFFHSFRTQDLIGIRKDYIITEFWRDMFEKRPELLQKKPLSLIEKFRFKVKTLITAQQLFKMCKQDKKIYMKSNQFIKFIYLIFIWLLIHIDCFFIIPVLRQKEQNIIMHRQGWASAFSCDAFPRSVNSTECYNYLTIF